MPVNPSNPFGPLYTFGGPGSTVRTSAGRAAKTRSSAFSGLSPSAGMRAAGSAPYVNDFISTHVPMLWGALVREFPREIEYWVDGDQGQTLTVTIIWKEGAEDEELSPGRYSHALVQHADLPRPPVLGDVVAKDGVEYDVVRVDATAIGYSTVVLQDRSEVL